MLSIDEIPEVDEEIYERIQRLRMRDAVYLGAGFGIVHRIEDFDLAVKSIRMSDPNCSMPNFSLNGYRKADQLVWEWYVAKNLEKNGVRVVSPIGIYLPRTKIKLTKWSYPALVMPWKNFEYPGEYSENMAKELKEEFNEQKELAWRAGFEVGDAGVFLDNLAGEIKLRNCGLVNGKLTLFDFSRYRELRF